MKLALALASVALLAACPKPRTSAATQPTPLAFDAAKSDPKAVEVVDAGIAALGGASNWDAIKELHFGITYRHDNQVVVQNEHYWDRWNGRHYFVATDVATLAGPPDEIKVLAAKHDLFDKDKTPYVTYDGDPLPRADGTERAIFAGKQLTVDLYYLAIIYKMKDPGVILALDNAAVNMGDEVAACKPSCTSIKVTFEAGVGSDTWFVNFNNDSHLPEVFEQQKGAGRVGYLIKGWSDAGGLKWPTSLQNIGLPSEVIEFGGVKVGEPDDTRYEFITR